VPVWGYEVYDVGEGDAQKETNTGRPNGRGPVAGFLYHLTVRLWHKYCSIPSMRRIRKDRKHISWRDVYFLLTLVLSALSLGAAVELARAGTKVSTWTSRGIAGGGRQQ